MLPILALLAGRSGQLVWRAEGAAADTLLATRVVAAVAVAAALLQVDALRFLGIREAIAHFRGRALLLPRERLAMGGVYRLVRHPLYLFGLIALCSSPVMTESALGFTLGVTQYVVPGSILEERKLVSTFGAEYEAYRRTVPWLVPLPRRSARRPRGQ